MPNFSLPDEVFLEAARRFPTPFYLYDEGGIRRRARALNEAMAWAPAFKEYFAVKALPNPAILQILKEEGCGLDCASLCELMLAERAGLRGDDIMFSANAMPPEEFRFARELEALINLDDISDIDTLLNQGGIPETLCLRYNPGGSFGEGNAIMGNPEESKYGFTRPQLSEGLMKLKGMGLKRFGLHAFLSSNSLEKDYYPMLLKLLIETGLALQKESGLTFHFVNLSGGLGIPYLPEEKPVDLQALGQALEAMYRSLLGGDAQLRLKAELGRWMTGPEGWLVSRAMHEKRIHRHYIGLDACASNLMRPAMYGAYHHITVAGKREAPLSHRYDITGSLCENNDKFAIDRLMPEIHMGDLLLIHDAGAHAHAMGYQYNGRLRCAEVLYREDGSYQLIRRAETPEDYFATLDGLEAGF